MKGYILSVIAVAALGSIASGICPDGEGQGLKKAVSLIMSLLLITAVGKPIISLVGAFDFSSDEIIDRLTESQKASYEDIWQSTFSDITEENSENAVTELLMEEFDLEKEDFSVNCELISENDAFKIKKITVELSGGGIFKNPRRIEKLLSEKIGCECIVS
ncbi:MAG: stage III sporulation protein AF [Clostridia bacterium]|nr:stage III sporulation protein AF [Clostridia bacterium]